MAMACKAISVASTLAFAAFGIFGVIGAQGSKSYRDFMYLMVAFAVIGSVHHAWPAVQWSGDGSAIVPALMASSALVYATNIVASRLPPLLRFGSEVFASALRVSLVVASASTQYPTVAYALLIVALFLVCCTAEVMWCRGQHWARIENLTSRFVTCLGAFLLTGGSFYLGEVLDICVFHAVWHFCSAWLLYSVLTVFVALDSDTVEIRGVVFLSLKPSGSASSTPGRVP